MKKLRDYCKDRGTTITTKNKSILIPCFNCDFISKPEYIYVVEDGEEVYLICENCKREYFECE